MTTARALTSKTLGAWLIKASRAATPIEELLRTDFRGLTRRCVRRTYRVGLVRSNQPVLFWLSGNDTSFPAGIYAQGVTTGPVEAERPVELGASGGGALILPVRLEPVDPPILRSELLRHPSLCRIEVIRMAAGSNPSFLTVDELAEVRADWPQVR